MTLPTPQADRTAVVTGASSGIGAEMARELARRGHGVTLVARGTEALEQLADELSTAHGVRAEVITADLSEIDERDQIAERLRQLDLEVSILVNNAGFSTMGPVSRSNPAAEVAMVRTDVEAVAHLCSLFLPQMVDRGRGAILNVASTGGVRSRIPGQAGYGASKAFVLSYTHAIRAEVAKSGVAVTVLCPGPVETGFGERAGITQADAEKALPRFMWVSSSDVARQAIDALDADKAVIIPGLTNRITAAFGYLAPRRVLMPLLRSQHPKLKD